MDILLVFLCSKISSTFPTSTASWVFVVVLAAEDSHLSEVPMEFYFLCKRRRRSEKVMFKIKKVSFSINILSSENTKEMTHELFFHKRKVSAELKFACKT